MARLRQCKPRELVAALKRAGFEDAGQIGSHRVLVHAVHDRQTTIPMHSGDIPRGLLKKIIKQAGLTESEFNSLL